MIRFLLIWFSVIGCAASSFAIDIERKIIIQDNTFYYITVDDNHQMATLYTGEITAPLKLAKARAVPAGRGISAQTNPLAWDLNKDKLYAVNFIDHSLNDRNEAIKEIPLTDLKPWSTSGNAVENLIMRSVDYPMYALNRPYLFVQQQSNYLNHFYFDGIMHQGDYWMAVSNNETITIWRYTDDAWVNSEIFPLKIKGHFQLISRKNSLNLITSRGLFYAVSTDKLIQTGQSNEVNLDEQLIIENRDENKIYTIKNTQIQFNMSLKDMIVKSGIELKLN